MRVCCKPYACVTIHLPLIPVGILTGSFWTRGSLGCSFVEFDYYFNRYFIYQYTLTCCTMIIRPCMWSSTFHNRLSVLICFELGHHLYMIIDSMVRVALPLVTASDTIRYIWGSCNSSVAPCLSTSIIASSHLKFCHLLLFHKQWHQSKHLFSLLISMLMVFSFVLNVAGKKDSRKMKTFLSVFFLTLDASARLSRWRRKMSPCLLPVYANNEVSHRPPRLRRRATQAALARPSRARKLSKILTTLGEKMFLQYVWCAVLTFQ